jgi:hypothetical protein
MGPPERALDLVIDALAVKRLTRLVTEDQIMEPVRNWVWNRYPPESTKLGYLLTCPHCTSIWVAAGVQSARIVFPKAWSPVARALALSGVTSLIAERE